MQIRVRVDDNAPEEWRDMEFLLGDLRFMLGKIEELEARTDALTERVNQLERENMRLAALIEEDAGAAQEWYEEQLDKAATHCARCGDELAAISWSSGVLTDLCPECESELAEEQATMLLPCPDEEDRGLSEGEAWTWIEDVEGREY